jgi:DNA replication protein DnaC
VGREGVWGRGGGGGRILTHLPQSCNRLYFAGSAAMLAAVNRYSSVFEPQDYEELHSRASYRKFGELCPTCRGTGFYQFEGETYECEKDYDDICIQKKLFLRYELANIPLDYHRIDWKDFNTQPDAKQSIEAYVSNLDNAIDRGLGLYVNSAGLGTGKTLIGTYVLKEAVKKNYNAYFCQFMDLVNISGECTKKIEQKLINSDIVCIDDIVSSNISVKQNDLFRYLLEKTIRHRVHNEMSTIVTSNLESEEFLKSYNRVFSLLMSNSFEIRLSSSVDYRRDFLASGIETLLTSKDVAPIT